MKVRIDLLPYQLNLIRSTAPYTALIGGTGCGKTFFLPRWLYVRMAQHPRSEWIVSAPTVPMLKRNPVKYVLQFLQENNISFDFNKADMTLEIGKLGTVYFISAETSDRMQGIHAQGIVGDEAGMFDRLWWDTAIQRISFRRGQILLLTTPYSENWLKTEVWDEWLKGNPDFHVENPRTIDNPFYPIAGYQKARERLPEWRFRMLFDGQFTKPAGLIYPQYTVVDPFPVSDRDWLVFGGVDFGFNNPFAVVWIAQNVNNPDEMFLFDEFKASGLTIDDMERVLRRRSCPYYADPGSKESLETLRARGVDMRVARKDVLAGITMVHGILASGRLKVFRTLKYTIDELNSYQWEVDRTGEPIDRPRGINDHLMDAIRYAVFTRSVDIAAAPTAVPLGMHRTVGGMFNKY